VFGSFVPQGGYYSDGPEHVYPEPSGVSTPHASAEDPAEDMEIDLESLFEPDPLPNAQPSPPAPMPRLAPSQGASSTRAKGPRERADVVVHFPNGKISFYQKSLSFETCCFCPGHDDCRLTRSAKPSKWKTRLGQGRPLGLLVAWLMNTNSLGDKAEHCNAFVVMGLSQEIRLAARDTLRGMPNGQALLDCERPLKDGEGPEPEDVP
jgi:hypothetical protein